MNVHYKFKSRIKTGEWKETIQFKTNINARTAAETLSN